MRLMRQISRRRGQGTGHVSGQPDAAQLSPDLEASIEGIVRAFGGSSDLVVRRLRAGRSVQLPLPWFISKV